MKKLALLLAAMPSIVFAADNTIRFEGQVSDQTCEIKIDDTVSAMVLLQAIPKNDLADVGSVAGEKPFTVSITNCKAPVEDGGLSINTKFGVSEATSGGNIPNRGTANNVALQLLNAPGGQPVQLKSGIPTPVSGLKLGKGETAASHTFAVRYVTEDGAAGVGTVQGSVQYALDYL